MPTWLTILLGCLGGISATTAVLSVWLKPLFRLTATVKNNSSRLDEVERKQDLDYKARQRSEKFQKAQIKALIAILDNNAGDADKDTNILIRKELVECLMEHV